MYDDRDAFWPEPPSDQDWPVDWLTSDLSLQVPDCPCCVELVVEPEPVVEGEGESQWAVPMGLFGPEPLTSLPTPGPTVAQLTALLAQLTTTDLTATPGPQALADTDALLAAAAALRVHLLDRLADVDTRQLHTLTGARSTRAWIKTAQPDTDSGDLPLARRLRALPHLQTRLSASAVSLKAGKKVAAALTKVERYLDRPDGLIDGQPGAELIEAVVGNVLDLVARSRGGLTDDHPLLQQLLTTTAAIVHTGGSQHFQLEQAFTLLAEHVGADRLPDALDELVCAILPTLLEQRDQDGREQADLTLRRRPDGTGWDARGRLDLECGELLHLALGAQARRDPANPDDTAAAQALRDAGLDPYDPDRTGSFLIGQSETARRDSLRRPRTAGRRLHDALKNLLTRYLDTPLAGSHDKQPVRISVTASTALLEGRPGAAPATTASGARIPATLLRRWWCNAETTAFLLSRGWLALGIQHTGRTLTALERRALDLQSRHGCAGQDCCPGRTDDPLTTLEPHHVRGYARTGTTNLADTIWACPTLHHDLHHGKTVRLRDGRHLNEHGWTHSPQP